MIPIKDKYKHIKYSFIFILSLIVWYRATIIEHLVKIEIIILC